MIREIIEEVRGNSMLLIAKVSSTNLIRDVIWHPSWNNSNVVQAHHNVAQAIKERL